MNEFELLSLKEWIESQASDLDKITTCACRQFREDHEKPKQHFKYDLKWAYNECYGLSQGKDLCYDRMTTPLAYASWYHPKRVNTFLSHFIDQLAMHPDHEIHIFDLGAGTGAVQWAFALAAKGARALGFRMPSAHIVNIDTSPLMLNFNRDYLWHVFEQRYDTANSLGLTWEYTANSWNNTSGKKAPKNINTIIAANYLFDASDDSQKIADNFIDLAEKYEPALLLILTSEQKGKLLTELKARLGNYGYSVHDTKNRAFNFDADLCRLQALRDELGLKGKKVTWSDDGLPSSGIVISRQQQSLYLPNAKPIKKMHLHKPPIQVISDMSLNNKQRKAAEFSDAPTIIVGPAGCGKSVVIAKKVFNTVKHDKYSPKKILVTTFNKEVINQLAKWIKDLFDHTEIETKENKGEFYISIGESEITLMHFDIIPTRIGGIKCRIDVDSKYNMDKMAEFAQKTKEEKNIIGNKFDDILNPEFLLEEYHRVIYGLEVGIKNAEDKYQKITRTGRGRTPRLGRKSEKRALVFATLSKYANHVCRNREKEIDSFIIRRQLLLNELQLPDFSDDKKYDYIFVDEFQDCTQADFKIFNQLLRDPDHLTIAGDLAQAVHLGSSAKIPRFEDMSKRKNLELEGSYRLPVRISEAIKPISESIQRKSNHEEGVEVVIPYKGSPPGARPIVVYANSLDGMCPKIERALHFYKIYGFDEVTILEKDEELRDKLKAKNVDYQTDSILRLKGLEKKCILWSTRIPIEREREKYEFVYTILSRTSSILIIALFDDACEYYKPIISRLKKERLIFWDKETEEKFPDFCIEEEITPNIDE